MGFSQELLLNFTASIFTVVLMWIGSGYVIDRAITPEELFFILCFDWLFYFAGCFFNRDEQNGTKCLDSLTDRLLKLWIWKEKNGNKVELQEKYGRYKIRKCVFSIWFREQSI